MIFYLKNRSPEAWSDKPQPDIAEETLEAIEVRVIDGSKAQAA